MGQILDNVGAVTTMPSACRLDELHRVAVPRRGRLASVQAMAAKDQV